MFEKIYGLDLGTYEIKVYSKKKETIWTAKSAIAMKDEKEIFSVGDEAFEMYEKAPENIEVIFPMKEGVISRFHDMQNLLTQLLKQERQTVRGANYLVAVPTDVTEVEKRAFYDLVVHSTAKAKEVRIVERAIASAVGLGLDVEHTAGLFLVDLGAETMELSIVASGGMVFNKIVKMGGAALDYAICTSVRRTCDFLIGRLTAESIRKNFDIFEVKSDTEVKVAGRNLITGVPQQKKIPLSCVRAAMKEPLAACIREIEAMLERTPPEVRRSIQEQGLYLVGGLANMKGLGSYIEGMTGMTAHVTEQPELCTVKGLQEIIHVKERKKLTYSI